MLWNFARTGIETFKKYMSADEVNILFEIEELEQNEGSKENDLWKSNELQQL